MTEFRKLWDAIYGDHPKLTAMPAKLLAKAKREAGRLALLAVDDPEAAELINRSDRIQEQWRAWDENKGDWRPVGMFPVKPLTYRQAVKAAGESARYGFIATAQRHGYLTDGHWLYKLPADEAAKIKGEESGEGRIIDVPAFLRTFKDNAPIGQPEEERVVEDMVQWKFTTGFRVDAVCWLTVCKRWPDARVALSGNVAVWRQGGEIVGMVQGLSRKD